MKDNEMIIYKDTFINKIKSFFSKIFSRNKEKKSVEIEKINEEKNISVDILKKEILEEENYQNTIDLNYEKLNKLSISKLKEIKNNYNSIIEKNERSLKRLKNKKVEKSSL